NPLIARTRHLCSIRAKSPSCFFTKEVIPCFSHDSDVDVFSLFYLLFAFFGFLLCFLRPFFDLETSYLHSFKSIFYIANVLELCICLVKSVFDPLLDHIDGILQRLSLGTHMLDSLSCSIPTTGHSSHGI